MATRLNVKIVEVTHQQLSEAADTLIEYARPVSHDQVLKWPWVCSEAAQKPKRYDTPWLKDGAMAILHPLCWGCIAVELEDDRPFQIRADEWIDGEAKRDLLAMIRARAF